MLRGLMRGARAGTAGSQQRMARPGAALIAASHSALLQPSVRHWTFLPAAAAAAGPAPGPSGHHGAAHGLHVAAAAHAESAASSSAPATAAAAPSSSATSSGPAGTGSAGAKSGSSSSNGYKLPPKEILEIVDASPQPGLSYSPDRSRFLQLFRCAAWPGGCKHEPGGREPVYPAFSSHAHAHALLLPPPVRRPNDSLPPLSEMSRPEIKLAGLRLDPEQYSRSKMRWAGFTQSGPLGS